MFAVGPLWRKLELERAKKRRGWRSRELREERRRAEAAEAERRAKLQALEDAAAQRISVRLIKALVAQRHGLTVADLEGACRKKRVVVARHEAIYIAASRTHLSYVQIGRLMGGRDYTTVLSGIQRHAKRCGLDLPRVKSVSGGRVNAVNSGRASPVSAGRPCEITAN